MKRLEQGTLLAMLFLLPTQLAYHVWPVWAYIYGLKVDYLSPAIYLSDIFLVALLLFRAHLFYHYSKVFLLLFWFAAINVLLSGTWQIAIFRWFKVFECVALALYISNQNFFKTPKIIKILFYSLSFYSLIGALQFLTGKNIGGMLYWLGERAFNLSTPGIALAEIYGRQYLRAYSTFSHPNSLAGYSAVLLALVMFGRYLKKTPMSILAFLIILLTFILTFSQAALFGLILTPVFVFLIKKFNYGYKPIKHFVFMIFGASLLSLITNFNLGALAENKEISQRLELVLVSGKMIKENIFFGVGLGNFIRNIGFERFSPGGSWVLQPVHNVILLIFSELGAVGVVLALLIILNIFKKILFYKNIQVAAALFVIILTGLFDHYWITLQQNLLLMGLVFGLAIKKEVS